MEGEGILGGGKMEKKVLEANKNNYMEKPLHSQISRKRDEVKCQET